MKRLHSFSALCALALALLIPAAAEAQQQGTVYLNDGSVLTGQVIEFESGEIEKLQERIARELGFRLVGHRLELYGVPLKPKTPTKAGGGPRK